MKFHLVSGDALVGTLAAAGLGGELIVCRECLVEGPISVTGDAFWEARADFLGAAYGAGRDDYFQRVVGEFSRLKDLKPGDELTLWFGDDVFCQINLWFSATIFGDRGARVFRAFPESMDFGGESPADIRIAFENRVELAPSDIELASGLWRAVAADQGLKLIELGRSESTGFRNLARTTLAAAGLRTRPQTVLRDLRTEFDGDFAAIFSEFVKREPIYGFGDSQVERILKELS